jgi:hypothetical protein
MHGLLYIDSTMRLRSMAAVARSSLHDRGIIDARQNFSRDPCRAIRRVDVRSVARQKIFASRVRSVTRDDELSDLLRSDRVVLRKPA